MGAERDKKESNGLGLEGGQEQDLFLEKVHDLELQECVGSLQREPGWGNAGNGGPSRGSKGIPGWDADLVGSCKQ